MTDPLFWLGLSILLVAVSLTAVLVAALPALQELSRAARSAEKLFDTLNRELPPTLEAIRLTGIEITNLKTDVSQNVQSAGRVVEQLDQSLTSVKQQARQAQVTTRRFMTGVRTAWRVLKQPRVSKSDSDFEPTAQVEASSVVEFTATETASETNVPVQPPISESQLTLKQKLEPDYLPDNQQKPESYR
jgi:uncharacterized protein YoxC